MKELKDNFKSRTPPLGTNEICSSTGFGPSTTLKCTRNTQPSGIVITFRFQILTLSVLANHYEFLQIYCRRELGGDHQNAHQRAGARKEEISDSGIDIELIALN